MSDQDEGRGSLTAFASLQPQSWQPLPAAGVELSVADGVFPETREGRGMGRLGRRRALFVVRDAAAFAGGLRCWEADGRVVLLDGRPRSDAGLSPEAVGATFGEPTLRLDYRFESFDIAGGEWVFPERGLATFVSGDDNTIYRLAAFPSTDGEGYMELYRLSLGRRR